MLKSRADAITLATVMENENNANSPAEIILKESGKMTFPCIAMRSANYRYGREICTFEKEKKLIEKYCRLHGYNVYFKTINE